MGPNEKGCGEAHLEARQRNCATFPLTPYDACVDSLGMDLENRNCFSQPQLPQRHIASSSPKLLAFADTEEQI